jgi:Bacterial CdiA-CT RNAse A domain
VLPLVNRTSRALSRWLTSAWDERLELRPDLDDVPALAGEREALWARIDKATFLSRREKRAAVGYGEGSDDAETESASKAESNSKFNPYHDGLGRFTTAEGVSGSEAEVPAEFSLAQVEGERQYSVDLLEEEALGGHTLRNHVAKSDEELIGRLRTERLKGLFLSIARRAIGTFSSREAANDYTNLLIQENSVVVDTVASGKIDWVWLEKRVGSPTGREAFRSGLDSEPYIRKTYNVGAFIKHDTRSPRGYRVHSAYPLND